MQKFVQMEFDRREGHLQRVANEMFIDGEQKMKEVAEAVVKDKVEPRLHAVETATASIKIAQAKVEPRLHAVESDTKALKTGQANLEEDNRALHRAQKQTSEDVGKLLLSQEAQGKTLLEHTKALQENTKATAEGNAAVMGALTQLTGK